MKKSLLSNALAAAILGLSAMSAQAEDLIRAITFTPAQVSFSRNFQGFVDLVNERGEGVVQIQVIGGPETIPQPKMGEAQMNGIADMFLLPAGLYLNIVPEGEAFAGSNLDPMALRAAGGLELVNEAFHEKGNAHVLAHVDGGAGFHLWTTKKPSVGEDGQLDLSGIRLRSSPLYRAFLEELGATIVVQPAGEVYTSLERGVVDGTGYPVTGLRDYGWDKFLKYRIDPGFFQTDVLISMNLDSWEGLSPEAKEIVQQAAIDHEKSSYEANVALNVEESEAMAANGIETIELTGAQRELFLTTAYDIAWERLKSRDATHHDELKEVFFEDF
ncbi:TRAP transporter substrate-binding protein DctP [Pseudooceanicola sp. HF7]|uniref:TRAP transporter substrate-binding protein DctP n=1 Tax=Pseudooceanicola sp. HF7 TaxID=2721560 RepID=UPI001431C745|nr:TRAP transporter substrate-binding protein DctP [Pseudooceanicola sp. HF7]NIZ09360.1 TRAP transporter substrate-binding protein DctP [Pseudooceanicola sp. HF7]